MKKRFNPKDYEAWELEHSSVWQEQDNNIIPSALFLKWWQTLAEKQYGDRDYWLEIAHELGYVSKAIDPKSGNAIYEPYGFEHDGVLMRKSLGLSNNGPLIFENSSINSQSYYRLWDRLFKEEKNGE